MRTSSLWQIALCVASFTLPIGAMLAHGQEAAKVSSVPPKLEKSEESLPDLKPAKPDSKLKMKQKYEQGKVTEVEVTTGKSHYYLKPNEQVGTSQPGDAQSHAVRGAEWSVFQFDAGKKKADKKDAGKDAKKGDKPAVKKDQKSTDLPSDAPPPPPLPPLPAGK